MNRVAHFVHLVVLLCLLPSISGCQRDVSVSSTPSDPENAGTIVYQTDSNEWRVKIIKQHVLYSEAMKVTMPYPFSFPTRQDATILRTITFGDNSERFVTSDGYTFGMPSPSVTKAGEKTRYSVLGLYKRKTTYDIAF